MISYNGVTWGVDVERFEALIGRKETVLDSKDGPGNISVSRFNALSSFSIPDQALTPVGPLAPTAEIRLQGYRFPITVNCEAPLRWLSAH